MAAWNFLTNHGLVLVYIGAHSESTGIEIAQAVGITERAARKILDDLEAEGYIARERIGRRNRYQVNITVPVPLRGNRAVTVGDLLALLAPGPLSLADNHDGHRMGVGAGPNRTALVRKPQTKEGNDDPTRTPVHNAAL